MNRLVVITSCFLMLRGVDSFMNPLQQFQQLRSNGSHTATAQETNTMKCSSVNDKEHAIEYSNVSKNENERKNASMDSVPEDVQKLYEDFVARGKLASLKTPSTDDIVFQLFTRKNRTNYERLIYNNTTRLVNSSFKGNKRTVVIIHGFKEDGDTSPWMKNMKNLFLTKDDMNIIIVQWTKLACSTWYFPSADYVNFVGTELGRLLNQLRVQKGFNPKRAHLIGFSLGAHVAGVAGKSVPGLARITGLDPAGPDFHQRGLDQKLDKSDAKFVDVIHTNGGPLIKLHFGYLESLGHVDFYPNDGEEQPGCPNIFWDAIRKFFTNDLKNFKACNHDRSYQLFIETLSKRNSTFGYKCKDYTTFQAGTCMTHTRNTFGLSAKPDTPGVFYLQTQAKAPYLSHHAPLNFTVGQIVSSTQGAVETRIAT